MRAPRGLRYLGLVAAIGLVSGSSALAGASRSGLLDWRELDLIPAAPEMPAMGPDRLAAGPDGQLALWNPADALLRVYPSVDAALAGDSSVAFALAAADDLAWTGAGLLVLDGRRLMLYDPGGQRLSELPLPGLVPTGSTLEVDGDAVYGRDVFGNRHPMATLGAGRLAPPVDQRLLPPSAELRWDGGKHVMSAQGHRYAIPDAIKAGGRLLSGGGHSWLLVDAVVGDSPLRVARQVISLDTGRRATLPVEGRLYAPSDDVAVDGRGHLIWMAPLPGGLEIGEVTP